MVLLLYSLALVARSVLAAPATPTQSQTPLTSLQSAAADRPSQSTQYYDSASSTAIVTFPLSVALNSTDTTSSQFNDLFSTISSVAPSITTDTASSQHTQSDNQATSDPVTSSLTFTSLTSPPLPSTLIITEVATAFESATTDPTPSSTIIVTVVVTETATATATATSTTSPTLSWSNRTAWAAPPQMTDLSSFNITYFPSGQKNLHIVDQIPSQASSSNTSSSNTSSNTSSPASFLQLVYPARSVNPGSKPEGGADFYATPLDLTGARNVTLEYSVFFPADFDWVKGGKLPGLFGGHYGCSGGASARDCFSTRLMWRPLGVGELYLYAPKDKQTDDLCADVSSVCDATYGFSIGRGAFNFTPGGWTRVRQTVALNTPGENDGSFALSVDDRPSLAIDRTDIFYRDVLRVQRKAKNRDHDDGGGDEARPTEFLGLFFSTFFGGHGKAYATPKEQYTWFKDFAITRHD